MFLYNCFDGALIPDPDATNGCSLWFELAKGQVVAGATNDLSRGIFRVNKLKTVAKRVSLAHHGMNLDLPEGKRAA